ncbi:uncharacterized protein BDW43DRAFT_316251 [Aspergillus alliaceus]|uniref:uncharacterized protein n=1 Tax=Petromyces alliaceus TaxID=209559 RepID=UPI0012A5EB68|nr:uncharacterized protein BDW43DRAFT_316251 [Aspergillus alliaceus]KAB8228044.1 hypothetical protein BDW43DRAFT_316251 [Aspergillus alliaceus]
MEYLRNCLDENKQAILELLPLFSAHVFFQDAQGDGEVSLPIPSLFSVLNAAGKSSSRKGCSFMVRCRIYALDKLQKCLHLYANGRHEQARELIEDTQDWLNTVGKWIPMAESLQTIPCPLRDGHPTDGDLCAQDGPEIFLSALRLDLGSFAEWINYPEVFSRHWKKSTLQAISAILLQQSFTADTESEVALARRISVFSLFKG